jgi:hypothetical protein
MLKYKTFKVYHYYHDKYYIVIYLIFMPVIY